jgi:hypothetical protein
MTNEKPMDRKVLLSTLWIFTMLNYIYADVYTLFFNPVLEKGMWQNFLEGSTGSITLTHGFVLITAILMETAIVMVVLSRVLKYRANRWANIGSGAFHTLFVAWSLIGDPATPFYTFFCVIEMACTLFIVWLAIRWRPAKESEAR